MNRVTPRVQKISNVRDMIGKTLINNCFPTFKGKLIDVNNEKCYFEILPNEENPRYNNCVGKIEYLLESMVLCCEFEEQ
jgi:hypothetical protein